MFLFFPWLVIISGWLVENVSVDPLAHLKNRIILSKAIVLSFNIRSQSNRDKKTSGCRAQAHGVWPVDCLFTQVNHKLAGWSKTGTVTDPDVRGCFFRLCGKAKEPLPRFSAWQHQIRVTRTTNRERKKADMPLTLRGQCHNSAETVPQPPANGWEGWSKRHSCCLGFAATQVTEWTKANEADFFFF